ncbi:MAG TPA: 23S rRNA (uracil(1939)-C(5))-methyltransferase RlmD [Ruminococcaceae bacterium]|nr:23S rRNA (uracil(1939)-C(5))-methyltransferase RlmD [Oscillospiraceae bacterium]
MTSEGSGVGHAEGMAVFVPMTAVGDCISAHILKTKKTYAYAKIDEILTPSADRTQVDCAVFAQCGGCVYRHIRYDAELKIKQQYVESCFQRIAKQPLKLCRIVGSEKTVGYRNKAQLPVREENGEIKIGFFSRHTHRVVNSDACRIQPEAFTRIAQAFREWVMEYPVSVYDEIHHTGLIRHLFLRASENCKEIMVCIVINGTELPHARELYERIAPLGVTGLLININREQTNVILGEKCRTLYGKGYITDTLCTKQFDISPLSFYQVNRAQAQRLYAKAAEYAECDENTVLLDMYCGVGTIGLTMADKVKQLIGVEIVPQAVEDAKKNAEKNGITNARFLCGDAAQAARQLEQEKIRPNVVVLDPPRKGCEESLIQTVVGMNPDRIVYVSCDPATLARDYARFVELGYACPEQNGAHCVTPFDLFPGTQHCEMVVLLSRKMPDIHIDLEINLDELDATAAETKATYQEIKDYVFKEFGFKVSSLNISQVKTECGIIERENYNKGKPDRNQPNCTEEKRAAIKKALKYFQMI